MRCLALGGGAEQAVLEWAVLGIGGYYGSIIINDGLLIINLYGYSVGLYGSIIINDW